MMEVVSPTSVAAPCRLEETAMESTMGTGEIFSSRQIAIATGATIRTVATLSIKAEISPANRDMKIVTVRTLPDFSRRISAIFAGMPLSIKKSTISMVPHIIMSAFQLTAPGTACRGRIPSTMNSTAVIRAAGIRNLGRNMIRTYMRTNNMTAIFMIIPFPLSFPVSLDTCGLLLPPADLTAEHSQIYPTTFRELFRYSEGKNIKPEK